MNSLEKLLNFLCVSFCSAIGLGLAGGGLSGWQAGTVLGGFLISAGLYYGAYFVYLTLGRVLKSLDWRWRLYLQRRFPLPEELRAPTVPVEAGNVPAGSLTERIEDAVLPQAPPDAKPGLATEKRCLTLWQRCTSLQALSRSWEKVLQKGGAPGPDGVRLETFAARSERMLSELAVELEQGSYRVQLPRSLEIPKPGGGSRRISVFATRDRIVLGALHGVLSAYWEPRFSVCSFAYRPRRTVQQATETVERMLRNGRRWAFSGDRSHRFFATCT